MALINIDGLFERIGLKRPESIGLALSGGGSKGFSHIGVLMALEKFGIEPNIIAGVSAGSIAAVMYAAGLSPLEMRKCFADAKGLADFREFTIPKDGIFKLDKFAKQLESWLPIRYLEELKIPTVVCATNLERGTQVGWCKGEIVPRVLASCSVPIVFRPVKINQYHYVDGGVLHNLPAWAIRDYCDVLYGSNCSPLNLDYKYKDSILDIMYRTYQMMAKSNVILDANLCDHLITPRKLSKHKTFDLSALDDAIQLGYDAACRVLENVMSNKK